LKSGHHHFIENCFGLKASSTRPQSPYKARNGYKGRSNHWSPTGIPRSWKCLLRTDLGTSTAIGATTQEIFKDAGLIGISDFDQAADKHWHNLQPIHFSTSTAILPDSLLGGFGSAPKERGAVTVGFKADDGFLHFAFEHWVTSFNSDHRESYSQMRLSKYRKNIVG